MGRTVSCTGASEGKGQGIGVKIVAAAAMLCVIIAMLVTAFQIGIYGDPEYKFYQKEYEKYVVTESLDMEMADVMEVTEHMMDYLIGREEELSIVTSVDGEEQDFFNEQDRLHMADVKNLFLGGLKLRTVCLVIAAVLILILAFAKTGWREVIPRAYSVAVGIFLGLILLLAIACSVNFTKCFTIFHQIFFTNDLWLFDARTDYMIRMLPEGFFLDMAIRIGVIFIVELLTLCVVLSIWKRASKRE